jgi:ABC-2 type transport system ATP-binding protein
MKSLITRLSTQVMILDLEKPMPHLPALDIYNPRLMDETTLEIQLHKDQSLNHLFQELTQHNIIIKSIRNKTSRLEELFIDLIADNKPTSAEL